MKIGTWILVGALLLMVIGGIAWVRGYIQRKTIVSAPLSTMDSLPSTPSSSPAAAISPLTEKVKVILVTNKGEIELDLDGSVAPLTVGNFVQLAKNDFYDGTTFHRVIPDFMIQGGDPLSKDPNQRSVHGTGGPGYAFPDEINPHKVVRGALAMANAGPGTNGSQFFIVTGEAFPHLDGRHTVFGNVVRGMEVVDTISHVQRDQRDNPVEPVVIEDVKVVTEAEPSV